MQVEPRIRYKSACKAAGFSNNRKKEELVTAAVIAAQKNPDSFVDLPDSPDNPATVTSMQNSACKYEVSGVGTAQARCTCPEGQLHNLCKHMMKVLAMRESVSGAELILAFGSRAGTSQKGLANLHSRSTVHLQPGQDALTELDDVYELSSCDSPTQAAAVAVSAAPTAPSHDATACQREIEAVHSRMCDMVAGEPEMQQHLLSHLNRAEGALARIQASHATGTAHPMAVLSRVQDTWGNSIVRKKVLGLDAFPKARRKAPQAAAAAQSVEAEALPFSKPKPARRKIGPRQQAKAAAVEAGQENSSAAANAKPSAEPRAPMGKPIAVKTAQRMRKCGECANCLRPASKKVCLRNQQQRLAAQ